MADASETLVGKELLGRSHDELASLLGQRSEELRKARFKHALNQLQKTHTLTVLRRDIARLKSALAQQARRAGETT